MTPFTRNMEAWKPQETWGVRIEYAPDALGALHGKMLSKDDELAVAQGIANDGRNAYVDTPSVGLVMDCFDWSTGIDFGHEYDGGGYVITFSDDEENPMLSVLVEWNDSYAEAAGLREERSDESACVQIGLQALNEFLAALHG